MQRYRLSESLLRARTTDTKFMTYRCCRRLSEKIIVVRATTGDMTGLGTPAGQISLHATLIGAFTDEKPAPSQPVPFRHSDKLLNTFLIHRSRASFHRAQSYPPENRITSPLQPRSRCGKHGSKKMPRDTREIADTLLGIIYLL